MASSVRLQPYFLSESEFDVPEGWVKAKFAESAVAVPVGKKWENKTVSASGLVPVIDQSMTGVIGFHSESPGVECSIEQPVFTFANHTCSMRWMVSPFSCIQNVFAFRGAQGIVTSYLYYASVGRVILEEYKGHAPQFRNMWIPVPSEVEQEKIGTLLRQLDDRIDLLRQTNATLEAIAQALFKSWFVDFDPVRAKAEGREPEGMDPATAALFPSEFEDSELGLIPKGWRAQTFGSLLSDSIGGDWGSDTPTPEQSERVAIIRGTDIPDLRSQARCRVPVRFTTSRKLASRALAPGDVVVEVSGGSKDQPTGRSIYVTGQLLSLFDCPVLPASFCRKFSPTSKGVGLLLAQHMDYIYATGKTWDYQNQSTGIANFQTTHFLATEQVVVPCDPVLDAFFGIVEPIAERVQLQSATVLANVRDTLLPRLISGRLRLPEAEVQTSEPSP